MRPDDLGTPATAGTGSIFQWLTLGGSMHRSATYHAAHLPICDIPHDPYDSPRPVAPFDTMTSMVATRQPISPQAAAWYQERWAIVRERLNEELRATSMEAKLRQLANLMQSAREMGWSLSLDEEDEAVRARWMALRRAKLGKA